MKPFLLDTNVIIDALRKRNNRHLLVELPDHDHGNLRRHAPARGEADAGVHAEPAFLRDHPGDCGTGRVAEGAVLEAWQSHLVPGCEHCRGLHRARLLAGHGEYQRLPDLWENGKKPIPEDAAPLLVRWIESGTAPTVDELSARRGRRS
ncbi:MAG TPA: hypothetical protein VKA02_00315 [Candidatus Acidoferrum sp.]|nr:hypothetical protein [Candidatus Acidoferrum sp.]